MGLRNLPTEQPAQLAELLTMRPGQVSSMGLTHLDDPAAITLFAFAAGESVSEEAYGADTLYHILRGAAEVTLPDRRAVLKAGDALMVPAGVLHAVAAQGDCTFLQVSVP